MDRHSLRYSAGSLDFLLLSLSLCLLEWHFLPACPLSPGSPVQHFFSSLALYIRTCYVTVQLLNTFTRNSCHFYTTRTRTGRCRKKLQYNFMIPSLYCNATAYNNHLVPYFLIYTNIITLSIPSLLQVFAITKITSPYISTTFLHLLTSYSSS